MTIDYKILIRRGKIHSKLIAVALMLIGCALQSKAQSEVSVPDSCYLEKRHWYIKTNGIGWLMGVTNVSFEFEVAKHLSFTIPMYWSSWNYPKHTTKFRILAYQPELRYWLNHDGGFFGGVHFGIGWWNIATGGIYRRQDHNGHYPAYGGGISLGWRSIPVKSRWRFECSLGVGYYHFYYDRFLNVPHGERVYTRTRNMFMIDNASLSVVYTFRMNDKIRRIK